MLDFVNRSAPAGARLTGLVQACHPLPTLAVTVLTAVLFISAGNRPLICVIGGLAILTGQLSIGWSNDLIDRDRDSRVGRTSKPVVSGRLSAGVLRTACVLAAILTVPLSLGLGWPAGLLHLIAVGAGWAYNLRLKSSVLSPIPYLFAFGALPVIATLSHHRHWPLWWVVVAAGLIGLAAHFANVLPDLAADAETGVRGLPHRLGYFWSLLVASLLMAAVSFLILLARTQGLTAGGLAVVLVLAAIAVRSKGAHGADRAFGLVMLAAAVNVAVLVGSGGLG